jgi:anti-anti-sigma factor
VSFAVTQVEQPGEIVVQVEGDIDALAAPGLWRAIEAQLGSTRHLVVDLERVSFIDSTGVGILIRAVNALREMGQRLSVRSPAPMTRHVFETVGLTRLIDIEP